jgi:hypothetical protein
MPSLFYRRRQIEISESSGTLSITVTPRPHWIEVLLACGLLIGSGALLRRDWASDTNLERAYFLAVFVMVAGGFAIYLSTKQVIEIDSRKIKVRKDLRGWESARGYFLSDSSQLEWFKGAEHEPSGLRCRVGTTPVMLAKWITEDESLEILTALQRAIPEAAEQLCKQPGGRKHFTTLAIGR